MNKINISILGFLINDEKHGYEIFKEISNKKGFGAIYSIKIGKMYAILNKFEDIGYVTSDIQTDGVRPPKKVYKITKQGKLNFEDWLKNPIKHGRDIRINLLLKLYFLKNNSKSDLNLILENQIKECGHWLENISKEITLIIENEDTRFLVLEFRKSQIEGYIQWLKWCLRRVSNG